MKPEPLPNEQQIAHGFEAALAYHGFHGVSDITVTDHNASVRVVARANQTGAYNHIMAAHDLAAVLSENGYSGVRSAIVRYYNNTVDFCAKACKPEMD